MKEQTEYVDEANDQVSQDELQTLIELEEVKREAESLRRSIRSRILAGAKVEPGPCSVSISGTPTIQVTSTTLRKLLGSLAGQILAALPRQRIFRLHVDPNTHTKHKDEPTAVFDTAKLENSDKPGQEFDLAAFVLRAVPLILNKKESKPSPSSTENIFFGDDLETYLECSEDEVFSQDDLDHEEGSFVKSNMLPA